MSYMARFAATASASASTCTDDNGRMVINNLPRIDVPAASSANAIALTSPANKVSDCAVKDLSNQTFDFVEELELCLQDLPEAIKGHLQRVRSKRCRQSEFLLGYHFDVGMPGCEPNTQQAIFWYSRAANRGHVVAQLNLGVLHETGHQGRQKRDYGNAVLWYHRAASRGHSGAQFNLGRLFWSGKGVERDFKSSFRFFKRAGKQGHAMALTNVGAMYMSGNGVPQNAAKARKWSMRAAVKNNAVAHHNIGVMYEQGLGGPANMDKANAHFALAMDPSLDHPVTRELSADLRRSSDPLIFT